MEGVGSVRTYTTGYTKEFNKKDVVDKQTSTDNVIDLTNPNRLIEELTQDKSDIMFLKIGEDSFLKIDLNSQSGKDLLERIKKDILSGNGKLSSDFSKVSFQEATGISIEKNSKPEGSSELPETPVDTVKKITDENPVTDEQSQVLSGIVQERENLKTLKPHSQEYEVAKGHITELALKLVSTENQDDFKFLLELPHDKPISELHSKKVLEILNRHEADGSLNDLLLTLNIVNPDNNPGKISEHLHKEKERQEAQTIIDKAEAQIVPQGLDIIPVVASNRDEAIAGIDKLAGTNPEVGELLDKLEKGQGFGKSLQHFGITKEDLAVFLVTGKPTPGIEKAMKEFQQSGDWPALNSIVAVTKIHRAALQERLSEKETKIGETEKALSTAKTPEEHQKYFSELYKLTMEKDAVKSLISDDTRTINSIGSSGLHKRNAVALEAIAKYEKKLETLEPGSKEYEKTKKHIENIQKGIESEAKSLDDRIAKGGKVSETTRSLAAETHIIAAKGDFALAGIEKNGNAKQPASVTTLTVDPNHPPEGNKYLSYAPPKVENGKVTEPAGVGYHIAKAEEYSPELNKTPAFLDLKISYGKVRREDAKDVLKQTGVDYNPKGTFEFKGKDQPTAAQKALITGYVEDGIDVADNAKKEIAVLKAEPIPELQPKDPKEKAKYVEKIDKINSLEATSTGIKTENERFVVARKKAEDRVESSTEELKNRKERFNELNTHEGSQPKTVYDSEVSAKEEAEKSVKEQRKKVAELETWYGDIPRDQLKAMYNIDIDAEEKKLDHAEKALKLHSTRVGKLDEEGKSLIDTSTTTDKDGTVHYVKGSIREAHFSKEDAETNLHQASGQEDAVRLAYEHKGKISEGSALNLDSIHNETKQGLKDQKAAYDSVPAWLQKDPDFQVSKAKGDYQVARQQADIGETSAYIDGKKAKEQVKAKYDSYIADYQKRNEQFTGEESIAGEVARAGDKALKDKSAAEVKQAQHDAELTSRQNSAKEAAATFDEAEAIRTTINIEPEKKQFLAAEAIFSGDEIARNIAPAAPEDSVRILSHNYQTSKNEIDPTAKDPGTGRLLQVEVQEDISSSASISVGPALSREMAFTGKKPPLDQKGISAAQDLLDLSGKVAGDVLTREPGSKVAKSVIETKGKWEEAEKKASTEAKEHEKSLKKEKELAIGAFEFETDKVKELKDDHWIAAGLTHARDWLGLGDGDSSTDYANFDPDKLKEREDLLADKYDRDTAQIHAFTGTFDQAIAKGKGLEFISAMKAYSGTIDPEKAGIPEFQAANKAAKSYLDLSYGSSVPDLLGLNDNNTLPGARQYREENKDNRDPTIKLWLAKGGPSPDNPGFKDAGKEIEKNAGSLVYGGYQKDIYAAKEMENRYEHFKITDVIGLDTSNWSTGIGWLDKTGSFLNRTDTAQMVVEIVAIEVLTAGLGSALAAGAVAAEVAEGVEIAEGVAEGAKALETVEEVAEGVKAVETVEEVAEGAKALETAAEGAKALETAGKGTKFLQHAWGGVKMMAVQEGINYSAGKVFGEDSKITKGIRFASQFIFVEGTSIKDFEQFSARLVGRVIENFGVAVGQQAASFIAEDAYKRIKFGKTEHLTAGQEKEAQIFGEVVSKATGILVPALIHTVYEPKPQPHEVAHQQLNEIAPDLKKGTPEYKELHDSLTEYNRKTKEDNPGEAKEKLSEFQEKVDKQFPEGSETGKKAREFISNESAAIAIKELPKTDIKDPAKYDESVREHLKEYNDKNPKQKISDETIERVTREQVIKKTVEGVKPLEPDYEKLKTPEGRKEFAEEITAKRKELIEKLSQSMPKEQAEQMADFALKVAVAEIIRNPGLSKDGAETVGKSLKEASPPKEGKSTETGSGSKPEEKTSEPPKAAGSPGKLAEKDFSQVESTIGKDTEYSFEGKPKGKPLAEVFRESYGKVGEELNSLETKAGSEEFSKKVERVEVIDKEIKQLKEGNPDIEKIKDLEKSKVKLEGELRKIKDKTSPEYQGKSQQIEEANGKIKSIEATPDYKKFKELNKEQTGLKTEIDYTREEIKSLKEIHDKVSGKVAEVLASDRPPAEKEKIIKTIAGETANFTERRKELQEPKYKDILNEKIQGLDGEITSKKAQVEAEPNSKRKSILEKELKVLEKGRDLDSRKLKGIDKTIQQEELRFKEIVDATTIKFEDPAKFDYITTKVNEFIHEPELKTKSGVKVSEVFPALEDFHVAIRKFPGDLSPVEREALTAIRGKFDHELFPPDQPGKKAVLIRVDIPGKGGDFKGFVLPPELLQGRTPLEAIKVLRLDYPGSEFVNKDGSFKDIKVTVAEVSRDQLSIPVVNGYEGFDGTRDPLVHTYPFSGSGFLTTPGELSVGTPEYTVKQGIKIEGATELSYDEFQQRLKSGESLVKHESETAGAGKAPESPKVSGEPLAGPGEKALEIPKSESQASVPNVDHTPPTGELKTEKTAAVQTKSLTPAEIAQGLQVIPAKIVPATDKDIYNSTVDQVAANPKVVETAHKYIEKTYDQLASFNQFADYYRQVKQSNPYITPQEAFVNFKEHTARLDINTGDQIDKCDGSQCVGQAQKVVEDLRAQGIPAYVVASELPPQVRQPGEPRDFGHAAAIIKTADNGFVILDPGLNFAEPIKIKPGEITTVQTPKSKFEFELGADGIINVKRSTEKGKGNVEVENSTFRTDKFENPDAALTQPSLQLQKVIKVASRDIKGEPQTALVIDIEKGTVTIGLGKNKSEPLSFEQIRSRNGKELENLITDDFATLLGQGDIAAKNGLTPGEFLRKRILDVVDYQSEFKSIRDAYAESRTSEASGKAN